MRKAKKNGKKAKKNEEKRKKNEKAKKTQKMRKKGKTSPTPSTHLEPPNYCAVFCRRAKGG